MPRESLKNKTPSELREMKEKNEAKIKYMENKIKYLDSQEKQLTRKERTHRLCTRGAMLEKYLSEFTDEQVETILKIATLFKKQTDELNKVKKRKAEVDRLFAKMYEDWVNERITEYNFNMMSQKYQTEQQELDERIKSLETELATEKETVDNAKKWIALIKQFSIPTELTAELLNSVIEKIVVHEAMKNDMCLNQREIDIYFRFIGKID